MTRHPASTRILAVVIAVLGAIIALLLVHEPASVTVAKQRSSRLEHHCRRVWIGFEMERRALEDPTRRAAMLATLAATYDVWDPQIIWDCVGYELDVSGHACVWRNDDACLIRQWRTIEDALTREFRGFLP